MMSLLRSAWVWGATAFLAVFEFVWMVWIVATDRDPVRRRAGRFMHTCGRTVTRLLPAWKVRVEGFHAGSDAYILVSNHQSFTDIPVLCCLPLDFKWVAKKELFSFPIAGWMFTLSGQIAVDRKDTRAGAKALIRAAKYLESGMSVMFFPEGTRSDGTKLLRFQDGPFRLAMKAGVPILPIVVDGTGALLPRNSLLFTEADSFCVRILPPVPADKETWQDAGALRDAVRQQMQDALDALRRDRGDLAVSTEAQVPAQ